MKTKPSKKLTLKDLLSRLDYQQAVKLLGPRGRSLLSKSSLCGDLDPARDIRLRRDRLEVRFPAAGPGGEAAVATIARSSSSRGQLSFECSACDGTCEHVGAAFSLVLEEKLPLGLSKAPKDAVPWENLGAEQLVERALAERRERARTEKFHLESDAPSEPWADYRITSRASGKSYRVALRGPERGDSYCSCPDFRTNTLGTCKHILYALDRIAAKFPPAKRKRKYRNREVFVHVQYGEELSLHLRLPDRAPTEVATIAGRLADKPASDAAELMRVVARLEQAGHPVTVYPDAEELIQRRLLQRRLAQLVGEIRRDPERHPLRKQLLKVELLPYQLDGVAFAAGAGRAILADDMGLGKTIQGIGVAELLAREAGIERVLVVCPTSLKSQWRNEVHRFCDRDVQLIEGPAAERAAQYAGGAFFTICNYEQVLRDLPSIEAARWDLIILDEGQRIKNWEAKTSRVVKALRSTFALVLSGTPLENRLDELYSVMGFVDDRRLGPAFRFFNRHRVVDEKGKVLGYKNLDELRANLAPLLLRRTRQAVLSELPPRTTEIVRIAPTSQQLDVHGGHMRVVSMITKRPYISEMDLLRLQKALLMCRMCANSTYLIDKQPPGFSSKLEHLRDLLGNLLAEPDRKTVLFSEWTTMLDLIQPLLNGHRYVRLDGSVPQKKRQQLVHEFQHDDRCRLFLTTNAGSTGLNLQSANTVVNVDLPWNPAVLEQRIARAHRMGQKRPVQVYVLVTEATIEENLLATLAAKRDVSMAVLDPESDVTQVEFHSGMEELRRRLEVLLGAQPEKATTAGSAVVEVADVAHRERVAAAGGALLGAAFQFLDELIQAQPGPVPSEEVFTQVRNRLLQTSDVDSAGRPRLSFTLPDQAAIDSLARTMSRLLVAGQGGA